MPTRVARTPTLLSATFPAPKSISTNVQPHRITLLKCSSGVAIAKPSSLPLLLKSWGPAE